MTEAAKGGCSSEPVGFEEKIGPHQCHDSIGSEIGSQPRVGRMLFRGVDMVFLTVNGHRMLTLHEILEMLVPSTPRSTFCARVEKMNALRHVCTKAELQKIKFLGGAKPNAIKCTVIAREHVLEYCEKYELPKNTNEGKSLTQSSEGNVRSCRKNQQGEGIGSSVRVINQFSNWSHNNVEDAGSVVNYDRRASQSATFKDLQCRSGPTNEVYKENIGNSGDFGGTQKEAEVSGKENGNSEKQNIRHSKSSNSDSWSSAGAVISQPSAAGRSIVRRRASKQRQVLKKRGTVSINNDSVRKPKHKINLEQVQASGGEVADDSDTVKLQETSRHHPKRARQASIDGNFSLDSRPASPLTLDLEPWPEERTERSRAKTFQAFNGADKHECGQTTPKCYLDNNGNEIQVPRSPTLLLKRSVNNKWHVAKSSLLRLNFDDEEVTMNGDYGSFLKSAETSPARSATNSLNRTTIKDASLATVPVSEPKPEPSPIKSSPKSTKTLSGKVTKSVPVACSVSMKKKARITAKKGEAKASVKTDEQAKLWPSRAANEGNRFGSDALVTARNKNSGARLIGNCFSGGAKSAESSRSVKVLNGKTPRKGGETNRPAVKDKSNGSVQKAKSSKANAGVVGKQKRRRRVQFGTFRLIETIPYPSSLVVKDGDLCPSLSMTYSAANRLPHCCHPLWRWCMGKAVLQRKGSQVGKLNPGEPQKEESCVIKSDSVGIENDDIFGKHGGTDDQTHP